MRLAASFCVAVLVSGLLFWLMRSLIWFDAVASPELVNPVPLGQVIVDTEPPPAVARQRLPAPPRENALPPSAAVTLPGISLPATSAPAIELPGLQFPGQLAGRPQTGNALAGLVSTGTGETGFAPGEGGFTGADLVPMASARPKYPRSAAEVKLEGWVELIFRIRADGYVEDVRVLDASPRGVFEDAAVYAMQQWVYAPYEENGLPVAREATQLFEFRAADIQPLFIWED